MLTMVHEDLHDLALPSILNLPLAHSARALPFLFFGIIYALFFSARRFLIKLTPPFLLFSYLLLFILQISAQDLIGFCDLGS